MIAGKKDWALQIFRLQSMFKDGDFFNFNKVEIYHARVRKSIFEQQLDDEKC
jgi:hypothetical protein